MGSAEPLTAAAFGPFLRSVPAGEVPAAEGALRWAGGALYWRLTDAPLALAGARAPEAGRRAAAAAVVVLL